MKRPTVGVLPLWDSARRDVWMRTEYLDGLLDGGALPLIFPLTGDPETNRSLCAAVDGLLFTGGQDVSPALYGQEKAPCCEEVSPLRDGQDLQVLQTALEMGKPVLGICRGLQLINAALGGSLYQDIGLEAGKSAALHRQEKPYARPVHRVDLCPGTPLRTIAGRDSLMVNSIHHQAVSSLAPGLLPAALSEDGLIEAAYLPDRTFFLAVQWHPEFLQPGDEVSRRLFSAFSEACSGQAFP